MNWKYQYIREITGGFGVVGLLFCQESCEGDDVCVDVLLPDDAIAVIRHCGYVLGDNSLQIEGVGESKTVFSLIPSGDVFQKSVCITSVQRSNRG